MIRHQPGQHESLASICGGCEQVGSLSLPSPHEARQLRDLAKSLLLRLLADRTASAERFREAGCRDAIEVVTGRTSFDNAIAATRQMISRMDALLTDPAPETGWSSGAILKATG